MKNTLVVCFVGAFYPVQAINLAGPVLLVFMWFVSSILCLY